MLDTSVSYPHSDQRVPERFAGSRINVCALCWGVSLGISHATPMHRKVRVVAAQFFCRRSEVDPAEQDKTSSPALGGPAFIHGSITQHVVHGYDLFGDLRQFLLPAHGLATHQGVGLFLVAAFHLHQQAFGQLDALALG